MASAAGTPLKRAEAHGHHIAPYRMYVFSALTLTVLMALTIGAARIDLGVVANNAIALAIATTKAFVVVQWFMGVKFGTSLIKLFAYLGFIWMTLMGLILVDYAFRHFEPVPSWTGRQESALPRKMGSTDNVPLAPIEQNIQNRIPKGTL